MTRRFAAIALGLTVASCAAPSPPPAPPPRATLPAPAPKVEPPAVARPRPPAPRPAPAPARPPAPSDTCGARPLQSLVGKPRTEIPVAIDPSRWRVTCTTCPVTMDFRADRLNIFYDSKTGIVKEVKCG